MNFLNKMDIKTKLLAIILLIIVLATVGIVAFGVIREKKEAAELERIERAEAVAGYDEDDVYHVNAKTVVNFKEPIIEQFNKESQFVVSSASAVIELELKQAGVIDVSFLNKSQVIKYRGTGRFYVDMSQLTEDNIIVDDENKTVTIEIPHTELIPIDINPDGFESEDLKKGLLAFGNLKFTPEEYNNLQAECKSKLEGKIDTKENRIKADENAVTEITRIYNPIVKSLDDEYSVAVIFNETGTASTK